MEKAERDAQPGSELAASLHLTFPGFVSPGDIYCTPLGEISTFELEQCLWKQMGQEANYSPRGNILQRVKQRQSCAIF